jgi:acyl transferase domain-containing protein/NAD(P)H-dependent flavin oxidoreductase YrpB (nitropropane dioxygenase family)
MKAKTVHSPFSIWLLTCALVISNLRRMTAAPQTNHRDLVLVADPCAQPNPRLVVAAVRAGARGVLDLPGERRGRHAPTTELLAEVTRKTAGPFVARLSHGVAGDGAELPDQADTVILAGPFPPDGCTVPARIRHRRVLVEVVSLAEAAAAIDAGVDGLVAKGCESGGRVGDIEGFVLAQHIAALEVPFWLQGGLGEHTAVAAIVAGAAGVLLDAQVALARESSFDDDARAAVGAMDGSETRVVGGHRVYVRPDLPSATVPGDTPAAAVAERLGTDLRRDLVPLGQDAACAASLARRHATVGGVVRAVRGAIDRHLAAAAEHRPLAPGRGVAASLGTRYPIAQGPMTRVSDRAEFAAAVAEAGGLPFLALALLSGPETRRLLSETAELVGNRPWGVGILGFVPAEVRAAQLEAVHDIRPPVALIAGGRPSQARPLEEAGIATYLHVPSPGLLDRFLREGARRFVFEGRECGGHVGPRASLPLWDAQVERLAAFDEPECLDVLFAGGIHDTRSAAMVAAVAAPLAARGARVGALMGTAYLFTHEAVASGAITPAYQEVARSCATTVLLETSPGHATRCVETEYVRAFAARKAELDGAGVTAKEMWAELEALNLGRLRIASKGLTRQDDDLVAVDEEAQRREGMYMIGQVAALRHELTTAADLHLEVTAGATAHLLDRAAQHGDSPDVVAEPARPVDVAIVGMAGMFPGAADVDQFWANVINAADCMTEVPADRWDADTFYDPAAVTKDAGRRTPSKWGGFLPSVPFDALAYGIPPRSLGSIESVQLLSLEVVSRALADAGYDRRDLDRERTSVIFGAEGGNDLGGAYGFRAAYPQFVGPLPPELDDYLPAPTEDSFPGVLVNVIAGRVANRLDLGGVNYTIDAACGASLAALDAACKELTDGTSDVVLCGAADVHNGINDYLLFASAHALSPTGRCRTFDASADGIALGEGVACVVLKRLSDAERDGDRIYAVVEGVAGSSDGRHLGLTAPRKEGQMRAVERAQRRAGVAASSIGLVEAHGTGTVVGDRTELATLTEVFTADGAVSPTGTVLGSVKSQIGHTKCAAGLAGLIKMARALHAGVLPPTINVNEPNGYYDAETSPFRFHDRAAPWPAPERRAGVSAFGFGGTNFHAVLRSHPDDERPPHGMQAWPAELFLVRAETEGAAKERLADLHRLVERIVADDPRGERHRLRDLARTVCETGSGPVRVALVADGWDDLATKLAAAATGTATDRVVSGPGGLDGAQVAFLHPGQGSQRLHMLGELFVAFPHLQSVLHGRADLARRMFPGAAFDSADKAAQVDALTDTRVAQPTLGLAALAMTRLLRDLGVEPDMAAGHSYGELVALATAGALDEATLLDLSQARGDAMVAAAAALGDDPGAMAAVSLPADELTVRLPDGIVLANHNGPRQAVVSGPTSAVDALVAELAAEHVGAIRLGVAAAFHSPLVAAAGDTLAQRLRSVDMGTPAVPVWSNTTAAPYPADPDEARALLAAQVGRPVRFVEQIEAMYAAGARIFVEAGPGRVLTQLVGRILGDRPHVAVACDVPGEPGVRRLLLALAELAVAGVPVDPRPLFRERAARLDPTTLPKPAPGWRVNGHLVCTADGEPVAGGLQPADRVPEVSMNNGSRTASPALPELVAPASSVPPAAAGRDAVMADYLRTAQHLADTHRDVMLSYLDSGASSPAPAAHTAVTQGDLAGGAGAAVVGAGNGHESPAAVEPPVADESPATAEALVAAEAPAPALPSGDALLSAILAVVGERTGYPVDMLDPDLDLEADLSIDSIKRVEIIGELTEKVGLPGVDPAAGVDESVVEELARLKTLRAIVAWIDGLDAGADRTDQVPDEPAPATAPAADDGPSASEPDVAGVAVPATALRYTLEQTPLAPAVPVASLTGRSVAIVGDSWDGLEALRQRLDAAGAAVEVVAAHRGGPAEPLPEEVAARLAAADGIVHLGAADPESPADARDVFAALAPALTGRARTLVAVSAPPGDPASTAASGVGGLMRSLARELPDRHVRAVELPADSAPAVAARLLADELLDPSGPPAVTYAGVGGRATRRVAAGSPLSADVPSLPLDAESVVVVTGGARGVTARAAVALARATGCRLELVGRTPPPGDEDPRTAAAVDRPALRRALLDAGELRAPAEIEAACNRILAEREIRATLSALSELGSPTVYHPIDVRDPDALAGVLADVRARHGRIDAIIHGAGVLDDRLARDKTKDGFDRVFATKVGAARTLLANLGDDVRLVVFFGSVSGVFGNRGQVDYSAANDALDELARRHNRAGGRRIISIDWGPWGGTGMISPELGREYARRGVGLIDPEDGVRALLAEMAAPPDAPAQVVVMRCEPKALEGPAPDATAGETAGPAAAPLEPEPAGEGLTLAALTGHG